LEWDRDQQAISKILFMSSELGMPRKHRYFCGKYDLGKSTTGRECGQPNKSRNTESGPTDSAGKAVIGVNPTEDVKVVPPPRVELGTC
jgi:hypothetical protein